MIQKFLRYAFTAIVAVSVLLTGYYYAYLGFIKGDSWEKNVTVEEKEVVHENVEPVSKLSTILNSQKDSFSKLASKAFLEKTRWVSYFSISFKDTEKINDLLWKFAFDGKEKNEVSVKIAHWRSWNYVSVKGKINGRTLLWEWEYWPRWFFVDKAVLNGIFSMVDRSRLDFFLDELGGFVNYASMEKTRLEQFDSKLFDPTVGESKYDLAKAVAKWIWSVFVCDSKGTKCEFDVNEKSMMRVTGVLLANDGLTTAQKTNISAVAKDILHFLDGTKIVLTESGYSLKSKNKRLIFDVQSSYEDDGSEYSAKKDVSWYSKKSMNDLVSDFEKSNPFFVSIMSNSKEIIPMLLDDKTADE